MLSVLGEKDKKGHGGAFLKEWLWESLVQTQCWGGEGAEENHKSA